jgi:hypothetical protein
LCRLFQIYPHAWLFIMDQLLFHYRTIEIPF